MRTAFLQTLLDIAAQDDRVWLLTGDLGFSVLEPFAGRFPGRYVNVGVAEQNMIGVAAGLALSGKVVFVYSIANFPTMRCLEQIRNDVCGHNLSVKIVAVGGGFSYGALGYSHHGIEDLAVMRALPQMDVIVPADPVEARLVTRMTAARPGPAYLRLGKSREPTLHTSEPALRRGHPVEVRPGRDVAVMVSGPILDAALKAAEQVRSAGMSPAVYSVPWLKPLEREPVAELARRYVRIVTVEEARLTGGLGGAVAEVLAELPSPHARLTRLGAPDTILQNAYGQDAARAQVGIGVDGIVAALRETA